MATSSRSTNGHYSANQLMLKFLVTLLDPETFQGRQGSGCSYAADGWDVGEGGWYEIMISFFGIPAMMQAQVWELIVQHGVAPNRFEEKYLLWVLRFLKQYANITVMASTVKPLNQMKTTDDKTFNCFTNDCDNDALAGGDTMDCLFQQILVAHRTKPGKFTRNKALYSKKLNCPSLRYKKRVNAWRHDIYRSKSDHIVCLSSAEVIGDEEQVKVQKRAQGQIKVYNRHIANWKCIGSKFVGKGTPEEKLEKHQKIKMVYVVLSRSAIENLLLAMVDIVALGDRSLQVWNLLSALKGAVLVHVCLKKGSGQLKLRPDLKLASMPIGVLERGVGTVPIFFGDNNVAIDGNLAIATVVIAAYKDHTSVAKKFIDDYEKFIQAKCSEELADVDASQIDEDVAEQAIACFEPLTPQQMNTPREKSLLFFGDNEEVEEPLELLRLREIIYKEDFGFFIDAGIGIMLKLSL
eukprot:jgi/Psemu1/2025/gm1.2025_g